MSVHYLFPTFQTDDVEHRAAEAFWRDLVEDLARSLGSAGEWLPFKPRTWADGATPLPHESQAVFDARCDRLSRAIEILQQPPGVRDDQDVGAWLRDYKEADGRTGRILCIGLVLSSESAERAKGLLRRWMDPGVTEEEMKKEIAAFKRTSSDLRLEGVIDLLNRHCVRATYGAVGDYVGQPAQSLMSNLPRTSRYSWVVNKGTHQPTGYAPEQKHPDLEKNRMVLKDEIQLREWIGRKRGRDSRP